ncbi:MAG: hypothetical protein ACR652_19275 [Methylocystis sp.]|uniref:hypothetical protein n=1 Tax=Methylocystis sp. TaxID=1911079 RepID=UPI003DA47521
MRYVLSVILLCAVAMPASAASKAGAGRPSVSKASAAGKQIRAPSHGKSRDDLGGIHPLVGSGGY